MPIVPDTKDWTWVLQRPCHECGLDVSTLPATEVAGLVRENAEDWPRLLAGVPADRVRRRPSDDRWSALEYACHVRDVYWVCGGRLHLMLDEDDPAFADWDQDGTAVDQRYGEQDPERVLAELRERAFRMADSLEGVQGPAWQRTGTRSDGARFTVDTFARYMVHDPVHHVWDVEQGYGLLAASAPDGVRPSGRGRRGRPGGLRGWRSEGQSTAGPWP